MNLDNVFHVNLFVQTTKMKNFAKNLNVLGNKDHVISHHHHVYPWFTNVLVKRYGKPGTLIAMIIVVITMDLVIYALLLETPVVTKMVYGTTVIPTTMKTKIKETKKFLPMQVPLQKPT